MDFVNPVSMNEPDAASLTAQGVLAESSPVSAGRILVVDDDHMIRKLTVARLQPHGFEVASAENGDQAIDIANQFRPDTILLDIQMPKLDGIDTCLKLRELPELANVPVIFLTALSESSVHERAFDVGATDFLVKPYDPIILLARVKATVRAKRQDDELAGYRRNLELRVRLQTEELRQTRQRTVFALAKLAQTRDMETGEHLERIAMSTRLIAVNLRDRGLFTDQIDDEFIDSIFLASILHDIGKVGIPDRILLKPGRLSPLEFEVIKTHTVIGGQALDLACRDSNDGFLAMARDIAYYHHERFDGQGYPTGIRGYEIPLSARITTVADVFDALTSERPYKEPLPTDTAARMMCEGKSLQFDPVILDTFLEIVDQVVSIRRQLEIFPPE